MWGTGIAAILRDLDECPDPEQQIEALSTICRQVFRLRRGDQDARRLEMERERLSLEHKKFEEQVRKKLPKRRSNPITLEDFRLMEQRDNI